MVIIGFCGGKGSGKNTSCHYIIGYYLLKTKRAKYFYLDEGKLVFFDYQDRLYRVDDAGDLLLRNIDNTFKSVGNVSKYGIKVFAFADDIKKFLVKVLGVPHECVWGTEQEKNTKLTNIKWGSIPKSILDKLGVDSTVDRYMTGRSLMQIFGTEIVRSLNEDAWVNSTFNSIHEWFGENSNNKIALIPDVRFINEAKFCNHNNVILCKLLRRTSVDSHDSEKQIDKIPEEWFAHIIDNRNVSVDQQCNILSPIIESLLKNN